jgi:hypothetical protein
MASPHPTWPELVEFELTIRARPHESGVQPSWTERLRARLFAARYDRQVDAGVTPVPGTALAVHHARLTAPKERAELSRALHAAMSDAETGRDGLNPRVPVQAQAIHHAIGVFEDVVERLAEPFPVRARGMARLRILLADGRGPLYRSGAGSLSAAMRGALAAL